jgi:signal recognition particle GTPase
MDTLIVMICGLPGSGKTREAIDMESYLHLL